MMSESKKFEGPNQNYVIRSWKEGEREFRINRDEVVTKAGALAENHPRWSKDAPEKVKLLIGKVSIRDYLREATHDPTLFFDSEMERMVAEDADKMLELWASK